MKDVAFAIAVHAFVTASTPNGGQPIAVIVSIVFVVGMLFSFTNRAASARKPENQLN
jgi:hypothetical protein